MLSAEDRKKLRNYIEQYKRDGRSEARESYKTLIASISAKDPTEAAQIKSKYGYKDSKMSEYTKFIDSIVSGVEQKVQEELGTTKQEEK